MPAKQASKKNKRKRLPLPFLFFILKKFDGDF